MKPQSLTGMLISLVSSLPTLSMYEEMDNRGKVAVGAFVVSGTSLLAAHMAFTVSAEPTMLPRCWWRSSPAPWPRPCWRCA